MATNNVAQSAGLTDVGKALLRQAKVNARVEAFQKDFAELRLKHNLDFYAFLDSGPGGIVPRITIMNCPKNPSAPMGHPDANPTQVGSELDS